MSSIFSRLVEKVLPSLAGTSTDIHGQTPLQPMQPPHPTMQARPMQNIGGQASHLITSMFSRASNQLQSGDEAHDEVAMASSVPRSSGGGEASASMSARDDAQRLARFNLELKASCINLHSLKRLALGGVPPELRITVYKLLLGYLPRSPEDWSTELARRRT